MEIVCVAEATSAAIAALASRCNSAPEIATIVETGTTGAIATTGASRHLLYPTGALSLRMEAIKGSMRSVNRPLTIRRKLSNALKRVTGHPRGARREGERMSEASPLATLLQERRAQAAALEVAAEEKRKKSDEIAAGVPSYWLSAESALGTAIDSANKDFATAASPSRFQFEPLSQPGGNFALGLLKHSGNNGKCFSVTEIATVSDGRVIARRRERTGSVLKVFEVSKVSSEDWSALILQIFRTDVPA